MQVLILVLMDDTLRELELLAELTLAKVLILVLMDDTLRALFYDVRNTDKI